MNKNEIREPVQARSIEKKNKIIEAGFELICEKGYYNTNTNEIAKKAGTSVGIIYQYFKDKHDIFIEGVKLHYNNVFFPMIDTVETHFDKKDFDKILNNMIDNFVKSHKLSQTAHEEITAMSHSDKDVAQIFCDAEIEATENLSNLLIFNGFSSTNIKEKSHIAINLIDDLCHEIVYHKHENMDYDVMKKIVVQTICNLFE